MERQFAGFLKVIKNTLRDLAIDGELSFREVAELAGLSTSTVCNLFDGTTKDPKLKTIWKLGRLMGLEIEMQKAMGGKGRFKVVG